MTTRITVAILLVTWTIIVIGDSAAYITARETLLTLMDDSLVARATPLLDYSLNPHAKIESLIPQGDTYEIRDSGDKVIKHYVANPKQQFRPVIIRKIFEYRPDGQRYRTVTVSAVTLPPNGPPQPIMTVAYSRPAAGFDKLTNYLILVLSSVGTFCGLATGWVALKVSRAALRPLTETADVIAAIDEKNLSRRIEGHKLPAELVPMTNRLNEMLERLERVFVQRKQFLADAAHELRTPTAALLTTLEVSLRRQRDQKAMTEAMESALADARLLRRLVDKLMEQARSDHAMDRPKLEQLDLSKLIRESVDTVRPMAREKQVNLTAEIPEECSFVTQRDRLTSIVLNLLTNAIEYNKVGGNVTVKCSADEEGVTLSVKDTGVGISTEHLPHIFEPFYRASRETQGDNQHLGLGLFLVQSHIQALRGKVQIESEAGVGTTITVTLPMIAMPAEAGRAVMVGAAAG